MRMMNGLRVSAALLALVLSTAIALAQSNPGLSYGQVPTPAQWNSYFSAKEDVLNFVPLNVAGGVMTGALVTAAPTTAGSGFNLPAGTAPSSPNNGDLWSTSAGLFVEINGSTIPLTGAGSGSFTATSPLAVTFPSVGVVNYAFNFAVANTFLAQQTDQGATTTQPGWFVQVAGDTVPRIHLGLTTLDVPTLSFGSGSATRDAFIQRVGAGSLRHGGPDAAAPVAQALSVQNVLAGTSNANGANFTINGSIGTGTGTGGAIIFQVASAGSSGTAQNTLSPVLSLGQAHTVVVTSPAASAFSVGLNGSVNPSFVVNDSTALQAAGLSVTGAVTGGVVSLDAIDSGANASIRLNGKGTGLINIGNLSSGVVTIGGGGGGLTVVSSFTAAGLVTYADMAAAAIATSANVISAAANVLVPASVIYSSETTTSFASTTVFDFSTFINTAVILTGNITTMTLNNVKAGQAGQIRFIQDTIGSRTSAWNSIFKFAGGVTPTLSTAANTIDVLFYSCISTSLCYASLTANMQ